jgi:PhzF family phenazine biosynthesis protein
MKLPFKQVDVFTSTPFGGNPVAVVLDASPLVETQMRSIANWTNLSETTFVFPPTQPGADYRLRIFTPRAELPFAGHPTIGTAHALIEGGLIQPRHGRIIQECMAGLITLTVTTDPTRIERIAFRLPRADLTPLTQTQTQEMSLILGVSASGFRPPAFVDVGPVWSVVQLPDAHSVLSLQPDLTALASFDGRYGSVGVMVFGRKEFGATEAFEVRAFAPILGVNEDPVCGSGNGCVAAYIVATGQRAEVGNQYTASQGSIVGREGRVDIAFDETDGIYVGGRATTLIEGILST